MAILCAGSDPVTAVLCAGDYRGFAAFCASLADQCHYGHVADDRGGPAGLASRQRSGRDPVFPTKFCCSRRPPYAMDYRLPCYNARGVCPDGGSGLVIGHHPAHAAISSRTHDSGQLCAVLHRSCGRGNRMARLCLPVVDQTVFGPAGRLDHRRGLGTVACYPIRFDGAQCWVDHLAMCGDGADAGHYRLVGGERGTGHYGCCAVSRDEQQRLGDVRRLYSLLRPDADVRGVGRGSRGDPMAERHDPVNAIREWAPLTPSPAHPPPRSGACKLRRFSRHGSRSGTSSPHPG